MDGEWVILLFHKRDKGNCVLSLGENGVLARSLNFERMQKWAHSEDTQGRI